MRKHWLASVLFLAALQFFLQFAQGQNIDTARVTLALNDESFETAIHKIEQQSAFRFFYRDEDIRELKNLSLPAGTRTIQETLNLLLRNSCLSFAQVDNHILLQHRQAFTTATIKGRVLTDINGQPVTNASVFLNNATIGTVTGKDGSFLLKGIRPGKYNLVVSEVGFETASQSVSADAPMIELQPIVISPVTMLLDQVDVHAKADPDREHNLQLFEKEFIGSSDRARNCRILNPEIIDLDFNYAANVLTASSADFINVDNDALGYKIKYKLANFFKDNTERSVNGVQYGGTSLFEEKRGSPATERRWQKFRLDVYQGSQMDFLRSLLNNSFEEEGFRVLRIKISPNPDRPLDSLIKARVTFYKNRSAKGRVYRDSLAYWQSKQLLPTTVKILEPVPLKQEDMVKLTNQRDLFALTSNNSQLYIIYSKTHRFPSKWRMDDLNDRSNNNRTILTFDTPYIFFDKNGSVIDPECISFEGAWGKNRVADLLPVNYQPGSSMADENPKPGKLIPNNAISQQITEPEPKSLN